ncbi:multicystatin-like [Haliotis rufescens]|uniref:multicystatin-like n=1 Tax=Haliotis rufescens TaxID=6454 RepID=UPI00201F4286|nr:multicystatin-like [Haliotis rufescens]
MNILALVLVVLPLATSQLLSSPKDADVTRGDIQQMSSFAVTQLNASLVSVLNAKTQVVPGAGAFGIAGFNYFLSLKVQNGQTTQICDVTLYSDSILHGKRLTTHACTASSKRAVLVGAPTPANVTDPEIQRMALYAVFTLNGLQGADNSLDQVISAQTQVVSGINYMLKIRLSDGTQTQICDVTIWDQPWSHMTDMTHHSCTSAKRRDIGMPGGLFNVDVNSLEVLNAASFALGKINGLQGANNSMEQIISAKAQVVSGMNYILAIRIKEGDKTQICNVKVWSQPWLNKLEMTQHSCTQVTKRAGGLLGGVTAVDANSAEIQEVANFAVTEINGLQGAQNSLVKVVNARKQIVAGINYILTLSLQNGDKTQLCEVRVWYQSWTNTKQVTDHHCSGQTKRQLGAATDADIHDQFVQYLAHYAVETANALDSTHRTYVELISAKTQVVAGTNYFFKIRVRQGGSTQVCDITLWRQVWMNSMGHVTRHSCNAVNKRGLFLGGVEPANLTAPVQQAVSFAEDALNAKMNNMFRMVAEKVDNITQQVVAGIKYSFDLHLVTSICMNNGDNTGKGITDCPASNSMPQRMTCKVSVWYQAWSDPKYQLVSDSCGQLS